jgi:hypothetical protein
VFRKQEPVCQEIDIEHLAPVIRFLLGQEVQQYCGKAYLLEMAGDEGVTRAQSPAAASMCKDNYAARISWESEDTI